MNGPREFENFACGPDDITCGDPNCAISEDQHRQAQALIEVPRHRGGALTRTWSEAINDWQRTTFGPATPERAWGRFSEEFEEMVEAECEPAEPPEKIAEEAADVVITLIGWLNARCPGQDLATAIERKMSINRARQWDVRGDGTGYHVSEPKGGA